MPLQSVAAFIGALRESRLLDAAQLQELSDDDVARFPDESLLATDLVRRGWLTNFQANQLLQGRGSTLVLGQYILLDRLGEGGMGEVFKARHQRMKRIVALKIIRNDKVANASVLLRFNREIEAAAQLMHPNIVLAYDAAEDGDTHFFVMEYVRGIDLAKLVRETGPLGVGQACDYIRQAAFGLQHAFERGLIHRDIKPANLLVAQGGSDYSGPSASAWDTGIGPSRNAIVKILDMGLARLRQAIEGEQATLTQEGMVMGTPDYIAPEQAVDSRMVDIRADIYSLGCTFYYLLTGAAPFPGGSIFEKLYKHRYEDPEPVEKIRPEVPAEVAAVLRRMMAKEPAKRYQTPGEIAFALQPFAKSEDAPRVLPTAAPAEPAPGTEEVTPPAPIPSGDRGVETMRAPAGYFPATLEQAGPSMPTHIGPAEPKAEEPTNVAPQSVARSGRRPSLNAEFASLLPEDVSQTGSGAGPTARLTKPAPVAPISPVIQQTPASRMALILGGVVALLAIGGVVLWAMVFRPSVPEETTRPNAYAGHEETTTASDPALGKRGEQPQPKSDPEPAKLIVKSEAAKQVEPGSLKSEDARKSDAPLTKAMPVPAAKATEEVLKSKEPSVAEVAPKTAPKKAVPLGAIGQLGGAQFKLKNAVFTTDGRFLVASSHSDQIRVWDLEGSSAEMAPVRTLNDYPPRCLAISGNGRQVFYGTFFEQDKQGQADPIRQEVLATWDVQSNDTPRRSRNLGKLVSCVACTDDGLQAITGSEDRTVTLWEFRSDNPASRLLGRHQTKVQSVALSPDGRAALSGGADTVVQYYDLSSDRAVPKLLKGHTNFVTCLAFSHDGRKAASGSRDKTVRVWDLATAQPNSTFKHEGAVLGVAFSPDGRTVATAGEDRVVKVWDARTGQELQVFSGHTRPVHAVAYSLDGRYLLSVSEDNTVYRWELNEAAAPR